MIDPPVNRREEFRKYLEQTGVIEAFTKVLIGLYELPNKPEHPEEALDFIRNKLITGGKEGENVATLKEILKQKLEKIDNLEKENSQLRGG